MSRFVYVSWLALASCGAALAQTPSPHPTPTPTPTPTLSPSLNLNPHPAPPPFTCTEVIGLTITAEWYGAGFEQLIEDARFQARTRPHTFVDQWADGAHEAWSEPVMSPCQQGSAAPDRVVLFAANWKLTSEQEWTAVLTRLVATLEQRYPQLKRLELYTVLRGPKNESCGDPKSVVDPMIDAAIAAVAKGKPALVHAGPKLEAKDCSVFEKGGPHLTEEGRKLVAQQLAEALR